MRARVRGRVVVLRLLVAVLVVAFGSTATPAAFADTASPVVTSTDYPTSGFHGGPGRAGTFTFAPGGPDVSGYGWSFAGTPTEHPVPVTSPDGVVTVSIAPPAAGVVTLYVAAYDSTGTPSDPTAYQFLVAEPSLPLSVWEFEETSGSTAVDTGTAGAPLTLSGGATSTPGYTGNALLADGTATATAPAPVPATSSGFSLALWTRPDALTTRFTAASLNGVTLAYRPEDHRWAAETSPSTRALSTAAPQAGQWTHLLLTYDGTDLTLWVDGVRQQSLPAVLTPATLTLAASFTGALDQARLWDRALGTTEAAATATLPVLRAHYSLDEGTGTTTTDEVSAGSATLTGDASLTSTGPDNADRWLHFDAAGAATGPHPPLFRTDGSFTLVAWVRVPDCATTARTALSLDDTNSPFTLGCAANRWTFSVPTPSGPASATSHFPLRTNDWTHLAVRYEAGTGRVTLFVDGAEQRGFVGTPGTGVVTAPSTGALLLGRATTAGSPSTPWSGDVDDVRLYSGLVPVTPLRQLWLATTH
ncbi:LamG domain-containing protein [Actinosynnema sp. NPDC020468]|uniref:LamG domain-containing protein n=1 Tax=Actinosynnema sp. NPDC020468 TaxID=3154488 RepID=UPI0033DB0693